MRVRLLPNACMASLLLACAAAWSGCAGYQLGTQSLFRSDVRTIHVPIVRTAAIGTNSWRSDLGVRLTEALQNAIERRTPFKVTHDATLADSTLTCSILSDSKRVLTETRFDDPRAIDAVLTVQTNWLDRQGNLLMENNVLPPGDISYLFLQTERFVPEGGQSTQIAFQNAIEDLADQIVSQMEVRW
jgi:hypothetical protein